MKRLRHYLLVRHRHNWKLFSRFAIVGGSGVVVNLIVFAFLGNAGGDPNAVVIDLPNSDFNVRAYHVYSTIAFLVANLWNFELNRIWAFKSIGRAPWLSEYVPFFIVGAIGQALGLVIITILLHPESPVSLEQVEWMDSSSGLREPANWAQLIMIAIVTPVSFVGNKIWTFRAVRGDGKPAA